MTPTCTLYGRLEYATSPFCATTARLVNAHGVYQVNVTDHDDAWLPLRLSVLTEWVVRRC